MNFDLPEKLAQLKSDVDDFRAQRSHPVENTIRAGASTAPATICATISTPKRRHAGLLAVHVPEEYGGRNLSHFEKAVVFEAAGYSILGPIALHCHAPDEGNIHLLRKPSAPRHRRKNTLPHWRAANAFLLRHDRAIRRRRLGPEHAEDDRAARWQRLDHQRQKVADNRCGRSSVHNHHGAHGRGPGRLHDVPQRVAASRFQDRADTRHHGWLVHGRPLGHRYRRPEGIRRRCPRRSRQGVPVCPGPPGAGPPDPLHALARCRATRSRHRRRICQDA